ncbi:type-F conjugative transfer system pilin assembly thiol-disulfide isomerase TrbB [Legionella sp. km772]|nr:type-F conjugative transfer system pilin assembly thiol-disulfide isomerase TrbB [Legionella sp. km772]
MRVRLFLSVLFAFIVLEAKASGSQWLTHMIAKQEGVVTHQREKPLNTNTQRKGFFSTHGLILFYGSQCPHCKQFAPILKQWVTRTNAELLPLSLDNQPLPEFPKFLPATTEWINAAFGGNAINYPALYVVNPKTKALYPVGFGSMTEAELNDRMNALIPKINAYELKGTLS